MRLEFTAAILLVVIDSAPACAIDCQRATTTLEHRICASRSLRAADDAMADAYSRLLHSVDDPDVRASLINSQRRWLAARESDLGKPSDGTGSDAARDGRRQDAIVRQATRDRITLFSRLTGTQPKFIADALRQRSLTGGYSGGPFAGYQASCRFVPDHDDPTRFSYTCFGSHAYQNGDRVCSENQDFASYKAVTTRGVATVENGQLKPVATCVFGSSNDSTCPGEDSASADKAAWNTTPTASQLQAAFGDGPLMTLDPELSDDDDDRGWLHACLTDPKYPGDKAATGTNGP